MRNTRNFAIALLVALVISACAPSAASEAPEAPATETTALTATVSPEPTATPEPSLTPTEAILDLEILEWGEFPIARLADPENTDTHVEVLIRNPNNFHVRVNSSEDELRLVNAAGEIVFTNPNPVYYIWEGSWMLPGETAALSACVCFWTSGMERQDFETLELVVPLEPATDLAYTPDVEVTLGEWSRGGSGFGVEMTFTNTSDQVLEEFNMRVMARDASGKFVGVAVYGVFVVDLQNVVPFQPGEGGSGFVNDNMIDYMGDPRELEYEINAIGIIAQDAGTPLADWQGVPIMPGAINGGEAEGGYRFSTQATIEEITQFYEGALAELGYSLTESGEQSGITFMLFEKGSSVAAVGIRLAGELNLVQITVTP